MTGQRLVAILILLSLAGVGCGTSSTAPMPSAQETLADSIVMAPGGQAYFGPLRLSFLKVTDDSRCPVDVTCIWVGNAAVHIGLGLELGVSLPEVLNTSDGMPAVDFHGFRVTLLELMPEPYAGVPIAPGDYRAKFRVAAVADTT